MVAGQQTYRIRHAAPAWAESVQAFMARPTKSVATIRWVLVFVPAHMGPDGLRVGVVMVFILLPFVVGELRPIIVLVCLSTVRISHPK